MRNSFCRCNKYVYLDNDFDLKFNSSKPVAMRIGKRYSVQCAPFVLCGGELKFVNEVKYLGVCVMTARRFKTSVSHLKIKFYRTFNCIYSRSKAANSEMVAAERLKAFCLPLLLYASESVSLIPSQLHELNNCINKVFDFVLVFICHACPAALYAKIN